MIDTIAITIPEGDFTIIDHNKFSPNTENLFTPPYIKVTGRAPFKAINNPSKSDKEKFGYLPRITLFKALRDGGFSIFLKVEFSIPKLLYGNNFDEVVESDFGEICWQIKSKLEKMGVNIIDISKLAYAQVSSIHYGKNLVFTNFETAHNYVREISKIDISRLQDTNQSDYRNEGHSFKYRSNNYEVIFYDKVADLNKSKISEKRAIEKDNYTQLNLFDKIKPLNPFEVLRIEVRLGNRKKIKQVIEKLELGISDLNFANLFSTAIAKKILLDVIKKVENSYPKILHIKDQGLLELATNIKVNNPEIKLGQISEILFAKEAIQNRGVREFRKFIDLFGKSKWARFKNKMKGLKISNETDTFKKIREQLTEFQQVRLKDYKNIESIF